VIGVYLHIPYQFNSDYIDEASGFWRISSDAPFGRTSGQHKVNYNNQVDNEAAIVPPLEPVSLAAEKLATTDERRMVAASCGTKPDGIMTPHWT
jgi:hypothetical protein